MTSLLLAPLAMLAQESSTDWDPKVIQHVVPVLHVGFTNNLILPGPEVPVVYDSATSPVEVENDAVTELSQLGHGDNGLADVRFVQAGDVRISCNWNFSLRIDPTPYTRISFPLAP